MEAFTNAAKNLLSLNANDTGAMQTLLLVEIQKHLSNLNARMDNLQNRMKKLDDRLSKTFDTEGKQISSLTISNEAKMDEEEKHQYNFSMKIDNSEWIFGANKEIKQNLDKKDPNDNLDEIKSIIKERFTEFELLKNRNFCKRCGKLSHKDPKQCPKRCSKCHGDHEANECYRNKICNWCIKALGHKETCCANNIDYIRRSLKCPICGMIGHGAIECSIYLIALGNIKSVLLQIAKILSRRRITRRTILNNPNFRRRQRLNRNRRTRRRRN